MKFLQVQNEIDQCGSAHRLRFGRGGAEVWSSDWYWKVNKSKSQSDVLYLGST